MSVIPFALPLGARAIYEALSDRRKRATAKKLK
jgi:hypothetical protein